jgi:lysophospholipase L1-like esterase
MKDRSKKKKTTEQSSKREFSPAKKRLFWGITLALPFLALLLLEVGLRIFNYGGNIDVFIGGPEGYDEYLRCNPNVARRYFFAQSTIPSPPKQLFLKQKPPNGYRIFVLGESSTAGFPFGNNVSFPNILERSLARAFPQRKIEVVNIAMSAINSYTLLDLFDEVLEQSPDAVLIYTGHNEFYGALGVGSVQSLGNSRQLITTYLKLQSIKSFILLRDVVGWLKIQFSRIFYGGSEVDPSATLMEGIVAEQTIPYKSPLYEAGKRQFALNMEEILRKAAQKNVPLVLSELVSNLHDQEPFISVEDTQGRSAHREFAEARRLEAAGEFERARQHYVLAKDFDALRFRAPEDFNVILHELADTYTLQIVPAISYFENESPNGIIGSRLIMEHLHPTIEGYYLLAKAFYETMEKSSMIAGEWPQGCIEYERSQGITELDSLYGALVIQHLKAGWPFKPKSMPNRFLQTYRPISHIGEIAFRAVSGTNFSLEAAHMELGGYYEKQGRNDKAYLEYNALITSIPTEIDFYRKAALVLLEQKEYDKAAELLYKSLAYKDNTFANKWLGQIAVRNEKYQEAVSYLTKADGSDVQVVFNLARAYYSLNQWVDAEGCYQKLRYLAPQSEYFAYLTQMRNSILAKSRTQKPR